MDDETLDKYKSSKDKKLRSSSASSHNSIRKGINSKEHRKSVVQNSIFSSSTPSRVPDEIYMWIFSGLNVENIVYCRLVCHAWGR